MNDDGYSIAEARDGLAKLVHQAESHSPVVIKRRGRPVAVLVSYEEYERSIHLKSFAMALERYYGETGHPEGLDEVFRDLRDSSPGRDVLL